MGITDTWQYDGIDRVISNSVSLADKTQHGVDNPDFAGPFTYQYDKLGNLMYKTGIGDYVYSNQQAGPHAVTKANGLNYQYDDNGNMLRAWADGSQHNERELEWSEFNKPTKITRNGKTVEFFYDANHNRYLKKNSDGIETFYFGKSYERVTDTNTGIVQHKHFVYADGKLIALNTQVKDADNKLKDKQVRYLHYDALNSVDMITDGYGLVVERRSYDTWGKQRKVAWREDGPLEVVQQAMTNRGYTGHEEIIEVGLVHMNGRVYDQELARFISPDPIVQAPYVTNSFNRYAYVLNNPLKYTDPTGFMFAGGECSVRSGDSSGRRSDSQNGCDNSNNTRNRPTRSPRERRSRSDRIVSEGSAPGVSDAGSDTYENDDSVTETQLPTVRATSLKDPYGTQNYDEQIEHQTPEATYDDLFSSTNSQSLNTNAIKVAGISKSDVLKNWTPKNATRFQMNINYSKTIPVGKNNHIEFSTGTNGDTAINSLSVKFNRIGIEYTRDEQTKKTNVKAIYGVGIGTKQLGLGANTLLDSDGNLGVAADGQVGGAKGSVSYEVDLEQLNENMQYQDIEGYIDRTNTQIYGNPLLNGF
ncbi:RHS repeat domain-containing protein [Vibrio aestuarianus]|uniref:RHS repeat-associated core domain-containing protein n=1 Tax=Vibrio aestuarianus TaxID=28171 RepID=A0A9X4F2S9_9VIBR|nr:RHS repeat-associated core domain-containing protein [Vibrio aestuarianus]MDE1243289.1 RHS repeat-associated core domain-containing protein [Vibrio aestuarianus]